MSFQFIIFYYSNLRFHFSTLHLKHVTHCIYTDVALDYNTFHLKSDFKNHEKRWMKMKEWKLNNENKMWNKIEIKYEIKIKII